jgi:transcriptional regulator with GAF, ATPase, and Fis domain
MSLALRIAATTPEPGATVIASLHVPGHEPPQLSGARIAACVPADRGGEQLCASGRDRHRERAPAQRTASAHNRARARSVEELRALGEVSQAVNSTLDLETVLTTIVAKAVELSGTDAGSIYTFDDSCQEFRLRTTCGMAEEMIKAIADQHITLQDPRLGTAMMERRAVQVPDVTRPAV